MMTVSRSVMRGLAIGRQSDARGTAQLPCMPSHATTERSPPPLPKLTDQKPNSTAIIVARCEPREWPVVSTSGSGPTSRRTAWTKFRAVVM